MKTLIVIFCFFISIKVSAQNRDTVRTDTAKHFKIVDAPSVGKAAKALCVIDGKIYEGNIGSVNPENVLTINILKPPGSTNIYGERGKNGVLLITTLNEGKRAYQLRFSNLSQAYKFYLQANKNDDSGLVYVLNGEVLDGSQSEIIKKLHSVIVIVQTVIFIEKFSKTLDTNNQKPMVVITTKK
ncbi:MAG TPA: hypothetical protein VFE53_11505 [Mucilaginibacter sp.]|jgi:hypothetical protein|nr:hypothetical protein [Mucilaginibacter sp.]